MYIVFVDVAENARGVSSANVVLGRPRENCGNRRGARGEGVFFNILKCGIALDTRGCTLLYIYIYNVYYTQYARFHFLYIIYCTPVPFFIIATFIYVYEPYVYTGRGKVDDVHSSSYAIRGTHVVIICLIQARFL